MDYFKNVKTLEELKKTYRKLASENHPDSGGDTKTMQEINNQYSALFNRLKSEHNAKEENKDDPVTEMDEEFINIIDTLINCEGIIIEVCGSWLWVSGNTKPYKDILGKDGLGFHYASKKHMWYKGKSKSKNRSPWDMDKIREKYGSDIHRAREKEKLSYT